MCHIMLPKQDKKWCLTSTDTICVMNNFCAIDTLYAAYIVCLTVICLQHQLYMSVIYTVLVSVPHNTPMAQKLGCALVSNGECVHLTPWPGFSPVWSRQHTARGRNHFLQAWPLFIAAISLSNGTTEKPLWASHHTSPHSNIQGVFFTGPPPKESVWKT